MMDILDYGENPNNYWDNVARFEAGRCLAALELTQQRRTEDYEKVTMPVEEKKKLPKAPEPRNERQPIIKECAHCGKKFEAWWKSTLYCGDRCKRKAQKGRTTMKEREPWTVNCPVCGVEFTTASLIRKYCGKSCQQNRIARMKKERAKYE